MDLTTYLIVKGRLISRNAESDIYLSQYMNIPVIVKKRVRKEYRDPILDERIRLLRTYREARIIEHARRHGVKTPKLVYTSLKNFSLVLEYIPGDRLMDVLNMNNREINSGLMWDAGVLIGRLHRAGVVHGDPHPSNFILRNNKLILIDFGLSFWSKSIKEQVYDIDVMYRSLNSIIPRELDTLFNSFKEGYISEYSRGKLVILEHEKVLKMGRYHERSR